MKLFGRVDKMYDQNFISYTSHFAVKKRSQYDNEKPDRLCYPTQSMTTRFKRVVCLMYEVHER